MPGDEYEVRGRYDDEIEERSAHGEPLGQKIALFSAILATLGAIISFLGGHTQNDALYYKNEAVLMKARASDSWSYYQAEDMKRHLAEAVARLAPAATPDDAVAATTYATRARALRAKAEDYDRRSEQADSESRHALRPHVKLSIAMTFVQVGIALASISALTRRRWLLWGAGACAAIGVGLSVIAWF